MRGVILYHFPILAGIQSGSLKRVVILNQKDIKPYYWMLRFKVSLTKKH